MARASSKPHTFIEGTNTSLLQNPVPIRRPTNHFHSRLPITMRRRPWFDSLTTFAGPDESLPGRQRLDKITTQQPMIKIRFSVPFRCHSRQMLCMGGSQFPFGWSFVSIAKLPMIWNPNDLWTAEVYLPLGMRLEYKYVILEEQVWTNQQDEDSEGVVEIGYRTGNVPGQPPDVQKIRKQMAIVDWQPGPNRVLQVPLQDEIDRIKPGDTIHRKPAKPRPFFSFKKLDSLPQKGPLSETWEELCLGKDSEPVLYRHDIWPYKSNTLTFEDARRFFLGE